jgi:hypothetical protein
MSISPFNYNFRPIKRCFNFDFQFYWFDETGAGLNLTGSNISVVVWDKKRENIISTMSTTILAVNPGHTHHAFTSTQTAAIEIGNYNYELALVDSSGNTYCYMDGIMPFVNFVSQ